MVSARRSTGAGTTSSTATRRRCAPAASWTRTTPSASAARHSSRGRIVFFKNRALLLLLPTSGILILSFYKIGVFLRQFEKSRSSLLLLLLKERKKRRLRLPGWRGDEGELQDQVAVHEPQYKPQCLHRFSRVFELFCALICLAPYGPTWP